MMLMRWIAMPVLMLAFGGVAMGGRLPAVA
jgi:hypothetical protein